MLTSTLRQSHHLPFLALAHHTHPHALGGAVSKGNVQEDVSKTVDNAVMCGYRLHHTTSFTQGSGILDLLHDEIPDSCRNKMIMSGHIHTPRYDERRGRHNLGSCYSLNFADANQKRGYYILKQGQLSFEPNKVSINFYRFYNEDILKTDISKLNPNDYIELYISELDMVKESYIEAVKKFTEKFTHIWIIPQVVALSENLNEDFKGYDIEDIMKNSIPEDLIELFDRVKHKLVNEE